MKSLLIILKLFPADPCGCPSRRGKRSRCPARANKKLDLVLDVLKSGVRRQHGPVAVVLSWDKLVAVVVPMIAKIVDLHNALGLFQKPTQPSNA